MKATFFYFLTLVFTSAAIAAPPVNDAFSARLSLVTGVRATGTTVQGTTEAGEPRPTWLAAGRYQASVWWTWTAPSNGWYEVTTAGSEADTVLVVSTGTSVGALTIVYANDDDLRPNLNFASLRQANYQLPYSRVIFQAAAGTPYALAVATSTNGAGPVSLLVRPSTQASPRLVALSFSPSPVNVAAASPKGTATMTIQSDTDFRQGDLYLYGTNGYAAHIRTFLPAQRTAGTATNGTYTVTFDPPGLLPAGPLAWGLVLQANVTEVSAYGRYGQCAAPAGIADTFPVINTGTSDTTAPVIASVTVTPTSVDTTTSYQDLNVSIHATDNLSGIDTIFLSLVRTNGVEQLWSLLSNTFRVSGTTNDGVYGSSFGFELGYSDPVGNLKLRVQAQDAAGNLGPLLESTQVGFPGPFTGVITVTQQVSGITLTQVSFNPPQVDVASNDQTVVVSADVTSPVAVNGAEFTLFMPESEAPLLNGAPSVLQNGTMVSGTGTAGRWATTYVIPRGYPPGRAVLLARFFTANDVWAFGPRGANPFPAGSSNGVAVLNTGAIDLKPPQVDFLAGSDPIFQDNCGEGMDAVLRISDDATGVATQYVATAQIQAVGSGKNGNTVYIYPEDRFSGDSLSGLYRTHLFAYSSFYGTALSPTNYLLNVTVSDRAGRSTTVFRPKRVAVLALPAAYQSWASLNFGLTGDCNFYDLWGPYADQDGDGQTALVEAYFDTNPTVSNAPAPLRSRILTNNLEMSWTEPTNTHGLAVFPVWSPDLVAWMGSGESVPGSAARALTVDDLGVVAGGGHLKRVLMTVTNPAAGYLRLQLTNGP